MAGNELFGFLTYMKKAEFIVPDLILAMDIATLKRRFHEKSGIAGCFSTLLTERTGKTFFDDIIQSHRQTIASKRRNKAKAGLLFAGVQKLPKICDLRDKNPDLPCAFSVLRKRNTVWPIFWPPPSINNANKP